VNPHTDERYSAAQAPAASSVAAALAGLAAGWLAAGSTGLLSHPLRHVLTWVALGTVISASWSTRRPGWVGAALLLLAAALTVATTTFNSSVLNVLAVAAGLSLIAASQSEPACRPLILSTVAVTLFAVYRVMYLSVGAVWAAFDALGGAIGRLAGLTSGQALRVGATFAGMDFLVLMAAFYMVWLPCTPKPRLKRGICAAGAIVLGQLVYLLLLSMTPKLLGVIPEPAANAGWTWAGAARSFLPWNLPVLGAVVQLLIASAMLRWSPWSPWAAESPRPRGRARPALLVAAIALAAAVPAVTMLSLHPQSLAGKKLVVYEKGFLNWLKPVYGEYGRLSIGMYGMLPAYVESLGGRCLVSPELSEADLQDADGLILIYPSKPWADGQLKRIHDFVERGGGLLVLGEHTVREKEGGSRFNDVLKGSAMQVRFDSAMFEIGGWLQSYDALSHPTTLGITDDRNQFGVVIGASVDARWPARPILVGRWGWADSGDPGTGAAMMGNHRLDPGERLGDLVLAAEQPMGKGKVIAFGDTSSFTNGITVGAHVFTSRLLAYLLSGGTGWRTTWRELVGITAAVFLAAVLLLHPTMWRTLLAAAVLGLSIWTCTAVTQRLSTVLPDGRGKSPNNLAYIDSTHLEAYSEESWREDGTMGLVMTFMRNGYLTLMLPELTSERLERAAVLVSIAPGRSFSPRERRALHEFVENGGVFICTVGYDTSRPSRRLLSEFGFTAGRPSDVPLTREPLPMGYFKVPFLRKEDYTAYVRFHAAWPIRCEDPQAQVIAYGPGDLPLIMVRQVGRGKVAVIGDTCFAMNKNLEHENGAPFEGMRENADFWRWFIPNLTGRPKWTPSKPEPPKPPTETEAPGEKDEGTEP